MFSSLAAGVVLGLSAGFAPGPLLTLVIVQTLKHDFKEGIKVAAAPLMTDIPIILAALLLINKITDFKTVLGVFTIFGGLYILYLAYESMRTGPIRIADTGQRPHSLRKGLLINALNPHPYLFWVTVGAPLILKSRDEHLLAPWLFICSFFFFIVGTKIFLAFIVGKSRTFLNSRRYLYIMRFLGCLLAAFAVFLIKDALLLLNIIN